MSVLHRLKSLFSGGTAEGGTRSSGSGNGTDAHRTASVAPPVTPRSYTCDLCGFATKHRGLVYDHIKTNHSDVIDRNGHIREEAAPHARP